jgi:hypothetical protein
VVKVGATNVSLILRDGVFGSVTTGGTGSDVHVQGATLGDPLVSTSGHNVLNASSAANVVFDHATVNGEISLASKSTLAVADSSFRFSTGSVGVSTAYAEGYLYTSYGSAVGSLKATLTNSTFDGGRAQLQVGVNDDVVIRGCKFSGYEKYGVYAMGALTNLDLGTATDSGANEFTGSTASGIYGLYDGRSATGPTIPVSGTSFNGVIPPADVVTKSTVLAACEPGAYCINTNGNSITFY